MFRIVFYPSYINVFVAINIAIPCSLNEEATAPSEAVRKIGYVGRAAAIFRVNKIYIYRFKSYEKCNEEAERIRKILEYLVTPPYLRKDLFKIDPDLRLAGLLPPLNLPVFGPRGGEVKVGDVRVGLVVRWEGYYSIVKIGNDLYVRIPKPYPVKTRLVVSIDSTEGKYLRGHVVNPGKAYLGYSVEVIELRDLLKIGNLILTGREGRSIVDAYDRLVELIKGGANVVFGSAKRGVDEIFREEGLEREFKEYMFINFIPGQGVETVRTEEAIVAVLSIINLLNRVKLPSGNHRQPQVQ